ncbi:hypothetical protein COOONC_02144, partial [Cooperia oncophora]
MNTLNLLLGLADVTSVLFASFFRISSGIGGIGPQLKPLIQAAAIFACWSFVAHMLGNMLIAINRYSALRLNKNYEKVWKRRNVRLIIGLQYGCAFAAFIPLFNAEYIFMQNDDGTYTYVGIDKSSSL